MKTRARFILEGRFRQWANGKTLAAVSAAALLGLALTAQPASALFIVDCPDDSGYGGPVVRVHVNGNLALTNAVVVTFDPETGVEIDTPVPAVLCLTPGAVDANGKPYINLLGPAGDGVYTDPLSGNTVTISAIPNRTAVPRVFVDKGNGGVSLMTATDLLATADLGPDTLTLQLDSQAHFGDVGGGLHTYGVNMDGTVLGRNPAAVVSVTGQAVTPGGEGENTDTVNHNPEDLNADVGPSLFAGTAAVPLKPGGLFTGAITEDIVCGTADVEFATCALQIRNTIDIVFSRAGETVSSSGSFGGGVTTEAGGGAAGMRLLLSKIGVPFDRFNAAVVTQTWKDTFELGAIFKPGELSDGINPPAAPAGDLFRLQLGGFDQSFALNRFVQRQFLWIKFYTLDTFVNGYPFKAVLTPLFGNTWTLVAAGRGAGLTAATTLVDVTIGNDKGGGEAKVARLPR